MTKNIYDLEETIKAMDRFLAPDAMDKRLIEKWRDAGEACALHFHLSPPAPDGDFAILLLPRRDVEKTLKIFKKDRVDVISFAAGVALAQQPGCSGGMGRCRRSPKDYPRE